MILDSGVLQEVCRAPLKIKNLKRAQSERWKRRTRRGDSEAETLTEVKCLRVLQVPKVLRGQVLLTLSCSDRTRLLSSSAEQFPVLMIIRTSAVLLGFSSKQPCEEYCREDLQAGASDWA